MEEVVQKEDKKSWKTDTVAKQANKPLRVSEITQEKELRLDTLDQEFNRVLGGVYGIEVALLRRMRLPIGLSVVVIAGPR